MSERPRYRIALAKEDFKFSAAHFTLFPDRPAELLHGHNYRVRVEVAGRALDDLGLLVDIDRLKRRVRELCARLDSRMLLPEAGPQLAIDRSGADVEVRWGGRRYVFPSDDVVQLPIPNVSIELLAESLWRDLASDLAADLGAGAVEELEVAVEETAGQSATCAGAIRAGTS